MGATGSVMTAGGLKNATAEDIGEMVGAMGNGEAYAKYKTEIINSGVTGEVLLGTSVDDLDEMLKDLGVTSKLHANVIKTNFLKLKQQNEAEQQQQPQPVVVVGQEEAEPSLWRVASTKTLPAMPLQPAEDQQVAPPVDATDCITKTPRSIMSAMFQVQGTDIDPKDIGRSLYDCETMIPKGFGDGINTFDCFISYRVAADAETVEKIYLTLKAKGIHAFWDKACLKKGENWKTGFMNGNRCVLLLFLCSL